MTSILKKSIMAITGLLWFGFLITHLVANLTMLWSAEKFEAYGENLAAFGPLLWVAEAGLVILLLGHVATAIRLTLENRKARPDRYAVTQRAGMSTFASRTMIVGGLILLVFLPLHVRMFKFGDNTDGLFRTVMETYQSPLWVVWYELALVALGFHLSHGLASALQSLGLSSTLWRKRMRRLGFFVGWGMAAGFMVIPIWAYLK